jgi:uncharacterized membrane protein
MQYCSDLQEKHQNYTINMLPLQNTAVAFGLLVAILAFVFYTSSLQHIAWKRFYQFFPSILLCYLLPSLLPLLGIVDKAMIDRLYGVARDFMLPCSLVLMTISVDFQGLARLGPKALIIFLTGTTGIIIGGPIALSIVALISPETFVAAEEQNQIWRGLATLAGSWIGGGPNQAALLEVYGYNQELYSGMVAVDIVCANLLTTALLFGAGFTAKIDKWLGADTSEIISLKEKVEAYRLSIARIASTKDLMMIFGVGLGTVALSHFMGDIALNWVKSVPSLSDTIMGSGFFWIVVLATTFGLLLSLTPAKKLEGAGASQMGSICIYFLVAAIGMKMDLGKMFELPWLILVGIIWLLVHISLMMLVAKIIKAPFFYVAVGSQANVGGAASAPVVASAFSPALASVGVLLAVLGYALGTYGGIICTEIMKAVSP